MRKPVVAGIFLLAVLILPSTPAFAEEESKDVFFTLGYKLWYNTWQSANGSYGPQEGANVRSYVSDPATAVMPSFTVKVKNFFLAGSYLFAPEYKFPAYTDVRLIASTPYVQKHEVTGKRSEWDVNVGYNIVPSLALTLGYKDVKQEITEKFSGTGLITATSVSEPEFKGPTVGILGSVPIGGGFGLYGNLAYSNWMKMQYKGGGLEYDLEYISSEIGMGYKLNRAPLSFTLGYRFQSIEQKLPEYNVGGAVDPISPDVTKGFSLGMNLIF